MREPPSQSGAGSLAEHLARAQALADGRLRDRVRRFLSGSAVAFKRGHLPRGRCCPECRLRPRYPDHRCAGHTAYLLGSQLEARRLDNDAAHWLGVWREFFDVIDVLLRT